MQIDVLAAAAPKITAVERVGDGYFWKVDLLTLVANVIVVGRRGLRQFNALPAMPKELTQASTIHLKIFNSAKSFCPTVKMMVKFLSLFSNDKEFTIDTPEDLSADERDQLHKGRKITLYHVAEVAEKSRTDFLYDK